MLMQITPGQTWTWDMEGDQIQLLRGRSVWFLRIWFHETPQEKPATFDFLTMDSVFEFMREEAITYPETVAMALEELLEAGF